MTCKGIENKREINGGADRDRTDDLLNAIHFQALTGVIQWQTVLDTI